MFGMPHALVLKTEPRNELSTSENLHNPTHSPRGLKNHNSSEFVGFSQQVLVRDSAVEPPEFPESSQTLSNLLCIAGISSGKAGAPSGGGCGSCSGRKHGHAWHAHVLVLVDVQMKTTVLESKSL